MADRIWRPVPGYPDVEVSDDLQFRSVEHVTAYTRPSGTVSNRRFPARKLKVQWLHKDGYATVFVSRLRRPIGRHVLVCLAWHGLPPDGKYYVLHSDGDPSNFTPENLYWGNHKDNAEDADKHGRLARGEGHGQAKLTEAAVLAIRASGETNAGLAGKYGVASTTIRCVRNNRTWVHI